MAAVLLAFAVALAGCGDTTEGRPTTAEPTGTANTTENPATTTKPEFPIVDRPRDIPLDDLNPCDVWSPDQLRQLGVSTEPRGTDPKPNALGYLTCGYNNHPPTKDRPDVEIGYTAITVLNGGVEDTLHGQSRTTSTVIEIAGFPAVQGAQPEGDINPCDVFIGTVDGQHLRILLATLWPNDKSVDETCAMARTAAEMAMETLLTLR